MERFDRRSWYGRERRRSCQYESLFIDEPACYLISVQIPTLVVDDMPGETGCMPRVIWWAVLLGHLKESQRTPPMDRILVYVNENVVPNWIKIKGALLC